MNNTANIRINYLTWLGWLLFFAVLFFRGCNPDPQFAEKIKIQTKEVKGKTIIKTNIVHVPITKKVRDTSGTGFYVAQIDKLFEENQQMQLEFLKMDSLQQIEAYNKAIEINAFKQQFDDVNINAYISGEVSGKIHAMKFDYTIKAQTLEVDLPKPKNNFYIGANVSNTLLLDKPLFSAGIGIKNKRGNIINASFDTEKRIGIGYYMKIF
jgi:lipopolysaccharide export system protein LptA